MKKKAAAKKAAPKKQTSQKPALKKAEKKTVSAKKPAQKEIKKPEPKLEKKPVMKETKVPKKEQKKTTQTKSETPNTNPPLKTMPTPTGKRRLIISYDKLPDEVMDVIRTKYPYGYNHDLKEVKGIDNKKFFVLPIELPDVIYLVKVDLRKPIKIEENEEEEDIFTPEEEFAGENDGFPGEEIEPMDGEGDEENEGKKKKKRSQEDDDDM